MIRQSKTILCSLLAFLGLPGCLGVPEGATVVRDFEVDRYLGRWYEIARLDHRFERGLSRVTAEYSLREDGGLRVINRGYLEARGKWKEAEGKAYFIADPDIGRLKVSFFGPFYGAYNIIALDPEYRWSMIVGPDTSYFWILAREPELDEDTVEALLETARGLGVDIDALIYPDHEGGD